MDKFSKNMDFLTIHWRPFRRQFPGAFPVDTFQYVRGKAHWMHHAFNSCNFSLILRGRGEFHRAGCLWLVQAPCVITQWPGEYLEYGPPLPEETWDELYFIYSAKLMPKFRQAGLVNVRRPVWPIANLPGVEAQIEELRRLSRSEAPERVVDRVDRVAERLIMETLLPPAAIRSEPDALSEMAARWRGNLAEPVDFGREAARVGMSLSTFRRRWQDVFSLPPGQYLLQIRIHEACRLLVETAQPIREIARVTGFEDELYFSRRFRIRMGVPPREYRKLYQLRSLGLPGESVP